MNSAVTQPERNRQSSGRAIVTARLGNGKSGHSAAAEIDAITFAAGGFAQLSDPYRFDEKIPCQRASEVRPLAILLIAMQELERKRITADLHDGIGQALTALSFGIGAALDSVRRGDLELTSDRLEKLACEVRASILELQRIAMNLRPVMLDDSGLIATLAWFIRELGLTHPRLTLNAAIDIAECDVLPTLRTPIFRIVQEAANNIVKHSGASEMRLRLYRTDGEIRLEVSDNGVGFAKTRGRTTPDAGAGMGLRGMRERAECSGGRFRLLSALGNGTRVLVAWPVRE